MEQYQEKPMMGLPDYWQRVFHRRWWLMGSVFLGWLAGTGVGVTLQPRYRSETVILVEQQKVPEHYVEPNVAVDLQERLQSMSQQILSRTRLVGIIDKLHLYTKDRSSADSDDLVARMRRDIDIDLIKAPGRTDQLSAFKISYSASSAAVAQQVTGELTSLFIDENLRNRAQLSEDTTAFLDNQLGEARKSLDAQEQRLREFRSQYLGQLPEQLQGNVQILGGLQGQLQAATDALNQSEQQHMYLQSLLNQYRTLRGKQGKDDEEVQAFTPPALDQKLETLKSQLADLSAKYTPQHPDVRRVQEEIAATEALRTKVETDIKSQKGTGGGTGSVASLRDMQALSPMMQIEGQLKANELEIDNQRNKVKKLEATIEEYQKRLNLAPVREQQMAAITRDHQQSRTYYESLLAKKQQSEMATDLEKRQQGEQFRMIDPPHLPQKPYWPNRPMLSLAGLGLGTLFGLGIIIALELMNPLVYRDEELQNLLGKKVLVCIPPLPTEREQRRHLRYRVLEGMAASAMLIVISAVTFFVYHRG